MLPKRRFWKVWQKMKSRFSTDFSMVRSPNRVLTPLKSASKIWISSFVPPSKSSFGRDTHGSKTLSERLVRISKTSACTLFKLNFNSESTRLACTFFNTHARSSTRLACTLFNTAGMHALQHGWHASWKHHGVSLTDMLSVKWATNCAISGPPLKKRGWVWCEY